MDHGNDATSQQANGGHHHHLDLGELGHDMGLVLLPHMIKDPILTDPHIPQVKRNHIYIIHITLYTGSKFIDVLCIKTR